MEKEKIGKIVILLTVLAFFGGTYYYYGYVNVKTGKVLQNETVEQSTIITQPTAHNPSNEIAKGVLLVDKAKEAVKQNNTQIQGKVEEAKKNDKKEIAQPKSSQTAAAKIRPSDKSTLAAVFKNFSGKKDPFSYTESHFNPFGSNAGSSSPSGQYLPGDLPPVPKGGSMSNLPSLPGPPSASGLSPLPSPPPSPENAVEIKGFIGDKVIAEIDGVVMALNKNEKFNKIKVLSVNPNELNAGFEINGKTYTKTLKTLSAEAVENIKVVKKYYN